ncbi:unnamed protein product [Amoebophrya sp. A25]|nr:unnamed protein product [Amoebophrya sp. A25]|eukprot:GSA25T00012608001.1
MFYSSSAPSSAPGPGDGGSSSSTTGNSHFIPRRMTSFQPAPRTNSLMLHNILPAKTTASSRACSFDHGGASVDQHVRVRLRMPSVGLRMPATSPAAASQSIAAGAGGAVSSTSSAQQYMVVDTTNSSCAPVAASTRGLLNTNGIAGVAWHNNNSAIGRKTPGGSLLLRETPSASSAGGGGGASGGASGQASSWDYTSKRPPSGASSGVSSTTTRTSPVLEVCSRRGNIHTGTGARDVTHTSTSNKQLNMISSPIIITGAGSATPTSSSPGLAPGGHQRATATPLQGRTTLISTPNATTNQESPLVVPSASSPPARRSSQLQKILQQDNLGTSSTAFSRTPPSTSKNTTQTQHAHTRLKEPLPSLPFATSSTASSSSTTSASQHYLDAAPADHDTHRGRRSSLLSSSTRPPRPSSSRPSPFRGGSKTPTPKKNSSLVIEHQVLVERQGSGSWSNSKQQGIQGGRAGVRAGQAGVKTNDVLRTSSTSMPTNASSTVSTTQHGKTGGQGASSGPSSVSAASSSTRRLSNSRNDSTSVRRVSSRRSSSTGKIYEPPSKDKAREREPTSTAKPTSTATSAHQYDLQRKGQAPSVAHMPFTVGNVSTTRVYAPRGAATTAPSSSSPVDPSTSTNAATSTTSGPSHSTTSAAAVATGVTRGHVLHRSGQLDFSAMRRIRSPGLPSAAEMLRQSLSTVRTTPATPYFPSRTMAMPSSSTCGKGNSPLLPGGSTSSISSQQPPLNHFPPQAQHQQQQRRSPSSDLPIREIRNCRGISIFQQERIGQNPHHDLVQREPPRPQQVPEPSPRPTEDAGNITAGALDDHDGEEEAEVQNEKENKNTKSTTIASSFSATPNELCLPSMEESSVMRNTKRSKMLKRSDGCSGRGSTALPSSSSSSTALPRGRVQTCASLRSPHAVAPRSSPRFAGRQPPVFASKSTSSVGAAAAGATPSCNGPLQFTSGSAMMFLSMNNTARMNSSTSSNVDATGTTSSQQQIRSASHDDTRLQSGRGITLEEQNHTRVGAQATRRGIATPDLGKQLHQLHEDHVRKSPLDLAPPPPKKRHCPPSSSYVPQVGGDIDASSSIVDVSVASLEASEVFGKRTLLFKPPARVEMLDDAEDESAKEATSTTFAGKVEAKPSATFTSSSPPTGTGSSSPAETTASPPPPSTFLASSASPPSRNGNDDPSAPSSASRTSGCTSSSSTTAWSLHPAAGAKSSSSTSASPGGPFLSRPRRVNSSPEMERRRLSDVDLLTASVAERVQLWERVASPPPGEDTTTSSSIFDLQGAINYADNITHEGRGATTANALQLLQTKVDLWPLEEEETVEVLVEDMRHQGTSRTSHGDVVGHTSRTSHGDDVHVVGHGNVVKEELIMSLETRMLSQDLVLEDADCSGVSCKAEEQEVHHSQLQLEASNHPGSEKVFPAVAQQQHRKSSTRRKSSLKNKDRDNSKSTTNTKASSSSSCAAETRASRRRRLPNLGLACSTLNSILSPERFTSDGDAMDSGHQQVEEGQHVEAEPQEQRKSSSSKFTSTLLAAKSTKTTKTKSSIGVLPTPSRRKLRKIIASQQEEANKEKEQTSCSPRLADRGDHAYVGEPDVGEVKVVREPSTERPKVSAVGEDDLTPTELKNLVFALFNVDSQSHERQPLRAVWQVIEERSGGLLLLDSMRRREDETKKQDIDLEVQLGLLRLEGAEKKTTSPCCGPLPSALSSSEHHEEDPGLAQQDHRQQASPKSSSSSACPKQDDSNPEVNQAEDPGALPDEQEHKSRSSVDVEVEQLDPGSASLAPCETLLWKMQVAEAYFRSPHLVQYTIPEQPLEPGQCIQFKYKHRTSYITEVPEDAQPGEVRLHKMTKNGPLPLSRGDAELKMLERPEVNRRDLMEQLRSGCRLCRREGQTIEDLVTSSEWHERNRELAEMYSALCGQAMDCLLATVPEDTELPGEAEEELDLLLKQGSG